MFGFDLSAEQQMIIKLAADFTTREIKPVALEYDASEEVPWEIIRKAQQGGLRNLSVPEEYGGQGLDTVTCCLVTEELAAGCAGITMAIGANPLLAAPLIKFGTAAQKERFLKPFCQQGQIGALALTEPGAGSDVAALSTRARRHQDGYLLNGRKCFITNGGIADLYLVFATVDPAQGRQGITAFLVPGDTPGLIKGRKERKMGIRCSNTSDVVLEDVWIPEDFRLGPEGEGFLQAMQSVEAARPKAGALALGIARTALDIAVNYASQRVQFGQPIMRHQAIQGLLAEMATKVEAARLLIQRAAWRADQGQSIAKEGAMAKYFAADVAMEVTTNAVQVLGGYGYLREYGVEKLMRDAKVTQIYEGSNQIQRLIIANQLTKG